MRGAQILPREEEKALLRETRKFFNKFPAVYAHVSAHQEEEQEDGDNSAVFDDSQVLDGEEDDDDDNYSDESTLQQSSTERNMYWESQEALLQPRSNIYSTDPLPSTDGLELDSSVTGSMLFGIECEELAPTEPIIRHCCLQLYRH